MRVRKGQGGLQYLMTYGWVVLVVISVGLIMWKFGLFNLGTTAPTTFSGFSKIKPQLALAKMTVDGAFTCTLTNGAGSGITIHNASAKVGTTTCTVTSPPVGQKVGIGRELLFSTTGCGTGAIGAPYTVEISITYNMTVARVGVQHQDVGKVRGAYEVTGKLTTTTIEFCGNGNCGINEDCNNCQPDCGNCCGNGNCEPQYGEDCNSCYYDCPVSCGDGRCDWQCGAEYCYNCFQDCSYGGSCGNGWCEQACGENCYNCPGDCSYGTSCGNTICESGCGENCYNCPPDCGYFITCGNGYCDCGEDCYNCPQDCVICGIGSCPYQTNCHNCANCPQDCGYCTGYSCPFLYLWDGSKYKFAKDFSGAGFIGFYTKPQVDTFPQDLVPIYNPPLKDGKISIRIVEERNEVDYIDELKLVAVDHPVDVGVMHKNARVEPTLGYFTLENPSMVEGDYDYKLTAGRNVVGAWNSKGGDILGKISKYDYDYAEASPFIEVDLGGFTSGSEVKLLVSGVSDYEQFNDNTKYVYIEVIGKNGRWVKATNPDKIDRIDYQPSEPYTSVYDLTGLFPTHNHKIRIHYDISTNIDWIGVDTSPQRNIIVHEGIHADNVDFHYRGLSRIIENGVTNLMDYTNSSNYSISLFQGSATKYGDVAPLLEETDDKYVITVNGDELALEFDVSSLPPAPEGYKRTYFVYTYSWFLPGSNVMGENYAPSYNLDLLPFRGMSMYPYFPPEHYPDDAEHNAYQEEWNTRKIG